MCDARYFLCKWIHAFVTTASGCHKPFFVCPLPEPKYLWSWGICLDPAIYLTFKCDVLLPAIAPHFAYGFCAKGVATRWPKICLHLLCIIGQGLVVAFQREWRMAWKFVCLSYWVFAINRSNSLLQEKLAHFKLYLSCSLFASASIFLIFFVTFIYDINCTKWSRDWPNNKSAGINLLWPLLMVNGKWGWVGMWARGEGPKGGMGQDNAPLHFCCQFPDAMLRISVWKLHNDGDEIA